MNNSSLSKVGSNRVAIVDGVRTPFVKAGTKFAHLSFQELGAHAVKSLVNRTGINTPDQLIFGTVLLDPSTPNWAREILFAAGLPRSVYADSVSNNCISGLVAGAIAADRIRSGQVGSAIIGGAESMSRPALTFSSRSRDKFLALFRARSFGEKLGVLARFRPGDLLPVAPSPKEPSTGLTMGQHMEITAKERKIPRQAQDELALKSHRNAKAAEKFLAAEIEPLLGISSDTLVRGDTTLEKLSSLPPAFDRSGGTLTAGNSSALTDGASAVLLMAESEARRLGREPLAYLSDYEFSALDPNEGLLMAPGLAVPRLLKRNQLEFSSFDLIEIHEAFAAQVLANVQAWEEGWREPAVGKMPWDRVNTLGGSIALGHPFAATGGRIITTLAHALKRRGGAGRGLISICAAGGMAGAMIIERD